MNYLVPDHISEADVANVLDTYYWPGLTYLHGNHEDYLRVWYRDDLRLYYRVALTYSAALVEIPQGAEHCAEIVDALGLLGLEQAIEAMEKSAGVLQLRESARLLALMGTNGLSADHPEADRVARVWRRMLGGSPPTVAGALFIAGFASADSPIAAPVLEKRDDPRWAPFVEKTVACWSAERLTVLLTTDIDRLLERAQLSFMDRDYQAAFEAASAAIKQNEYTVQAWLIQARALDGLGDHWGAWIAMLAAKLFGRDDDHSDFDVFIAVHKPHVLKSNEASDAARNIALTAFGSYQIEPEEFLPVFLEHDLPWRAQWSYLAYLYTDTDDLSEVEALQPDSALLAFHRGRELWKSGDVSAALAAWQTWEDRPEVESGSFDEFGLRAYERLMYTPPKLSEVLVESVREAVALKNYDLVLQLTEFWASRKHQDLACPVWRGIALTFTQRSNEAVVEYDRAIALYAESPDLRYLGENPVSTAYFNRACERAHLKFIDAQIFDDLFHAVALAPRFAEEARTDDYLQSVWGDPRFEEAIGEGLIQASSKGITDQRFDDIEDEDIEDEFS